MIVSGRENGYGKNGSCRFNNSGKKDNSEMNFKREINLLILYQMVIFNWEYCMIVLMKNMVIDLKVGQYVNDIHHVHDNFKHWYLRHEY